MHTLAAAWPLLFALALGYTALCAITPFRRCTRCDGTGRQPTRRGYTWRGCTRCHGFGARPRAGRRTWTYLRRTRRAGTRPANYHRKDDTR